MTRPSKIFEKNYRAYCEEIARIDFAATAEKLGLTEEGDRLRIPFFNGEYLVTREGMEDGEGNRPAYGICVILAKYLLLCPDPARRDTEWASFKDFKKASNFTNVNFFTSETERAIDRHFAGRLEALSHACGKLNGAHHELEISYDLSMEFAALPRISLLLLFNDREEGYPARATVLFHRHSEYYLDPESLIMTSAALAKLLRACDSAS